MRTIRSWIDKEINGNQPGEAPYIEHLCRRFYREDNVHVVDVVWDLVQNGRRDEAILWVPEAKRWGQARADLYDGEVEFRAWRTWFRRKPCILIVSDNDRWWMPIGRSVYAILTV